MANNRYYLLCPKCHQRILTSIIKSQSSLWMVNLSSSMTQGQSILFSFKSNSPDNIHHQNIMSGERADWELQREALGHNLRIQHRTMVIATIAVVVSILASTSAIIVALTHHDNLHENITVKVVK